MAEGVLGQIAAAKREELAGEALWPGLDGALAGVSDILE